MDPVRRTSEKHDRSQKRRGQEGGTCLPACQPAGSLGRLPLASQLLDSLAICVADIEAACQPATVSRGFGRKRLTGRKLDRLAGKSVSCQRLLPKLSLGAPP